MLLHVLKLSTAHTYQRSCQEYRSHPEHFFSLEDYGGDEMIDFGNTGNIHWRFSFKFYWQQLFLKSEGQILKELIENFKFVLGVGLIVADDLLDEVIDCFHSFLPFS